MLQEKSFATEAGVQLRCQRCQPSLFREPACCSKLLASRIKVKLVELRSAASWVCRDPLLLLILCTHTCTHAHTIPLQSSCLQATMLNFSAHSLFHTFSSGLLFLKCLCIKFLRGQERLPAFSGHLFLAGSTKFLSL